MSDSHPPDIPHADMRATRRWSWFWILPLAALALAIALWARAATGGKSDIQLFMQEGYGLKVGDQVRYRGIQIGTVDGLELAKDGSGVVARLAMADTATDCMRAGTLFWVVRPQLGIGRVSGIDTLVSSRYIAVQPGDGERLKNFVALDEPPVTDAFEPGSIELVLQAEQSGSLKPGAPVFYRQLAVGAVISVGLSSDGSAIEARIRIREPYVHLVRTKTKFWDDGRLGVKGGIFSGLEVNVDSLESLVSGGVAFATPYDPGDQVKNGHRFRLYKQAEDDWEKWKPNLSQDQAANGQSLPRPVPAVTSWTKDSWWSGGRQSRLGWMLPTEMGLLAPADMAQLPSDAKGGSLSIEIAGVAIPPADPTWKEGGLALIPLPNLEGERWPTKRIRRADAPEDLLLIGDPALAGMSLSASRLSPRAEGGWTVDPSLSLEMRWHGAAAIAPRDGALIGVLLVEKGQGRIALPPTP